MSSNFKIDKADAEAVEITKAIEEPADRAWGSRVRKVVEAVMAEGGKGAVLAGLDLRGARLDGLDLAGVSFVKAKAGANFSGCNLRGADFTGADCWTANFTGADLTGAVFDGARMRGAVFTDAVLDGVDFSRADTTDAIDLADKASPK